MNRKNSDFTDAEVVWLQSFASQRVPSSEAEDMVSETLLRAISSGTWHRERTIQERRAWLRRILEGLRIDQLRRQRADALPLDFPLVEASVSRSNGLGLLDELGAHDAVLLLLRDVLGCEAGILALVLGSNSKESALRASRRARQRLRERTTISWV